MAVGSYRSDVVEPYPSTDMATPLAREIRELLTNSRFEDRMPEESLDGSRTVFS